VYDARWGATGFNPTDGEARFRPVRDASGAVVPTAYLGATEEVALAEGLLRGASALQGGAPRRLYAAELDGLALREVRTVRELRLGRLHGAGLTRLKLLRAHVIDCDEADYPYTARWGQALWGCRRRPHGLAWTSKQADSGRAYLLWTGRVAGPVLQATGPEVALDRGAGLERVRRACAEAGVDFEG
jgi:hypothetical protein